MTLVYRVDQKNRPENQKKSRFLVRGVLLHLRREKLLLATSKTAATIRFHHSSFCLILIKVLITLKPVLINMQGRLLSENIKPVVRLQLMLMKCFLISPTLCGKY